MNTSERMRIYMKEKIAKLIEVKSILSFVVIIGVTYGFITGLVTSETYCALATSIITYYFTRNNVTN